MVSAGPLKGARFTDVCWEDLKRAARSYKQDPRFNQYAKRMVSEKALGSDQRSSPPTTATSKTWRSFVSEWVAWLFVKAKGKFLLSFAVVVLSCILLSKPLFYAVLAKSLAVTVRLLLRRSVGLVITLIDAILDEAAANLEASLITAPARESLPQHGNHDHSLELQHQFYFHTLFMHLIFSVLGLLIGRHWPRAQQPVRQLNLRP